MTKMFILANNLIAAKWYLHQGAIDPIRSDTINKPFNSMLEAILYKEKMKLEKHLPYFCKKDQYSFQKYLTYEAWYKLYIWKI